jgi:hypothetical protein
VSGASKVEKASLRELDAAFANEIHEEAWLTVQFNPESLKVAFANQLQQPAGAGDQGGGASQQFVGAGSTKLSVQLWFDVSSDDASTEDDVRKLTRKVAYFITPQPVDGQPSKHRPPIVRFVWGSFQFDGVVESLDESLEFFSPEGRPLRASVSLTITQQKIQFQFSERPPPGAPGTVPLTPPATNQSVQQLLGKTGGGTNWQPIAAANGIDNPRFPSPAKPLNLRPRSP